MTKSRPRLLYLIWILIVLTLGFFLSGLALLRFPEVGIFLNPDYLGPAEYENKVKVAELFVSIAGFSAVVLTLMAAWQTIREGQLEAAIELILVSRKDDGILLIDNVELTLPYHYLQSKVWYMYAYEMDLILANRGKVSAYNPVIKISPSEKYFTNSTSFGFSIDFRSESYEALWGEFAVGNVKYLRFDGSHAVEIMPGDDPKLATITISARRYKDAKEITQRVKVSAMSLNSPPSSIELNITIPAPESIETG